MKLHYLVPLLGWILSSDAFAWGQEGHSIVGEIAQHRLTEGTRVEVARLLGSGVSLASIASWADDERDARPETYNWHFVDIPVSETAYDAGKYCKASSKGDCVVAELDRLKTEVHCATTDALKSDALRFIVHFIGDIHQPLHTVEDEKGGNQVRVAVYVGGATCTGTCTITPVATNLHTVWDSTLIQKASWNWGGLAQQIDSGLPPDTSTAGSTDPKDWAEETHRVAQQVWTLTPANHVVDEQYYQAALPVVKQQLGIAGVRLARFLNDAIAEPACPVH